MKLSYMRIQMSKVNIDSVSLWRIDIEEEMQLAMGKVIQKISCENFDSSIPSRNPRLAIYTIEQYESNNQRKQY